MGMIQQALNQSMMSLLGGAVGYTQSPHYKMQQTAKAANLQQEALSKLEGQDREIYLRGVTQLGGDLQKGLVAEYLLPGTKGKEQYADVLAETIKTQSASARELEALQAQRKAQMEKAGTQSAVEQRREALGVLKKWQDIDEEQAQQAEAAKKKKEKSEEPEGPMSDEQVAEELRKMGFDPSKIRWEDKK